MLERMVYIKTDKGYIKDVCIPENILEFCNSKSKAILLMPLSQLHTTEIFDFCLKAGIRKFEIVDSEYCYSTEGKYMIS